MKDINGVENSIQRNNVAGLVALTLLIIGIGGWATTTELSGAIISPGVLIVDTKIKNVQHQIGGTIEELNVRDGDRVHAGQVLVKLSETQILANLEIFLAQFDQLTARQAREEAEQDDADAITFPATLIDRQGESKVRRILEAEERLFVARRASRAGRKGQLKERIAQYEQEINGLIAQSAAKERERGWIKEELVGVRQLWNTNLVQFNRVTSLEREGARVDGDIGRMAAIVAETKGKIAETELQILQVDQDLRMEVGKDLADVRGKLSELAERRVVGEDQLKRSRILAPVDGIVHQLEVHTVGGVVKPGDVMMQIVPLDERLIIEARVPPQNVDEVHANQFAVIRFSTLNQRATPELNGQVSVVSADVVRDEKTGTSSYLIQITVADSELARLKGLKLIAGMPVEAFLQTRPRTVMSYLMKPLWDQVARAWRET